MDGFGTQQLRPNWKPRKPVTDWRVLLMLAAQLVAVAYSYGQLNERVSSLHESVEHLTIEVQQLRGGR